MKTKRRILTILLVVFCMTVFGQLNPIKNLNYVQWHGLGPYCPQVNCFDLTWDAPDSSATDTLLGYNIYRNNILWLFTTWTIGCSDIAPCPYMDFYDGIPFWLTIKAVYNSTIQESIADDSVEVYEFLISVPKYINDDFIIIINNPIKIGENITIYLPSDNGNKCTIQIYNSVGQIAGIFENSQPMQNIITVTTNQLNEGIYYVVISLENKIVHDKILLVK